MAAPTSTCCSSGPRPWRSRPKPPDSELAISQPNATPVSGPIHARTQRPGGAFDTIRGGAIGTIRGGGGDSGLAPTGRVGAESERKPRLPSIPAVTARSLLARRSLPCSLFEEKIDPVGNHAT